MRTAAFLCLGTGMMMKMNSNTQEVHAWAYRDDIGAFWGIKGYEEMVSEVGTHHGHLNWPQNRFLGTYDSASLRRGFLVFARNCANCHGIIYKKYDILLDKAYRQLELAALVGGSFSIHPAHHHFKQYYYQEWDERDRYIHDRIYPTYFSQDQAKNANGGVWPTDLSKIRMRPGGLNYVYNILTGYHYKAPQGMDVPKGKSFNPYFDHMIIGMPRQLYDGLLDYEDGTPASTPQMAYDVTNFINYVQRRVGYRKPDKYVLNPIYGFARNNLSLRWEMYSVRDGVYYNHFKKGFKSTRAAQFRGSYWT